MSILSNTTLSLQQEQAFEVTEYLSVVSVVVLIHDWFLTIESEFTFIWNPKWNLGTLLYFFARYPAFVDTAIFFYGGVPRYYNTLSPPVRALLSDVTDSMILFGIGVAEVIMIIFVWAMWGRGRRMAIFLAILALVFSGVSAMGLVMLAKYISLPNPSSQSIPIGTSGGAFINFATLTLLEVILLFLVLLKAAEYSRSRSSSFVLGCFQHGLLYYVVLVVLSATNLVLILTNSLYDASLSIQRTFHAILSARMLLHLRRSAHRTRGVNSTSLVSEIIFQHGSNSTGDSMSSRGRSSVI